MESVDIIVIGGGHAGCEAALAAARMGLSTRLVALNLDAVALMPCNPAVGGTAKGHLVREVDALGGEMGLAADDCLLQSKLLNTSKGPAVQSLRAQADKRAYTQRMRAALDGCAHLSLLQAEAVRICHKGGQVCGVEFANGTVMGCRAVIVCAGVYLKSSVLVGLWQTQSGPAGYFPANALSASLAEMGLPLRRFKTGTPARIDRRSVDFAAMEAQYGDQNPLPFSFLHERVDCPNMPCYLTYTNSRTHEIIRENLHQSPLFTGVIEGIGARYCPSIEDKVVRFADKLRHQVFVEPETRHGSELYVQGMSSSLPEPVQREILRTLPGLERAHMIRCGYAIEYDCIDAAALAPTLEVKHLAGLYMAGQVNGSSGYEEAAAQGLVAGMNAALKLLGHAPFILGRDEAYIGVLVDDLITKGVSEPYRMMTARAEYRLLLRQDNADLRLTEKSYRAGLASQERMRWTERKAEQSARAASLLRSAAIAPPPGFEPDGGAQKASQWLLRGADLRDVAKGVDGLEGIMEAALEQAAIEIRYEGYIRRQKAQVQAFQRLEKRLIPAGMDYMGIHELRIEARQKLTAAQPHSLGQASRIAGVTPADVAVLMVLLEKKRRQGEAHGDERG